MPRPAISATPFPPSAHFACGSLRPGFLVLLAPTRAASKLAAHGCALSLGRYKAEAFPDRRKTRSRSPRCEGRQARREKKTRANKNKTVASRGGNMAAAPVYKLRQPASALSLDLSA
ncbi:hypothetical protein MRX96_019052 [Rhipicephalus microplus]